MPNQMCLQNRLIYKSPMRFGNQKFRTLICKNGSLWIIFFEKIYRDAFETKVEF
jgi:hypothetical protein